MSEYSNGQSVRYKRYYKKIDTRDWEQIWYTPGDGNTIHNGNHYGANHVDAEFGRLDPTAGGDGPNVYIWFYVYYKKDNGQWVYDSEKTNATNDSWDSNNSSYYNAGLMTLDNFKNSSEASNHDVVRCTWYYHKTGSVSWVIQNNPCPSLSDLSNAPAIYDGAAVGAEENNLLAGIGETNAYIWFYEYLTKSDSRTWNELGSDDECGYADFDFAYRNNPDNKAGYANGDKVKVHDYNYYKVEETNNTEWVVTSYSEGATYPIMNENDLSSLPNGGAEGSYAVLNGNKSTYINGTWGDYNSSYGVSDYSDMSFKWWPNVETAITSKYADATISNDIFQGCYNLKKVDFLSGVVKGLNDRNTGNPALEVFIGKDVTEIAPAAFNQNRALKKVTFDKDYSKLTQAELENYPKPLTIGNNAFNDCNYLEEIEIPNRTVSIGNNAFSKVGTFGVDTNNANDEAHNDKEFKLSFERRQSADGREGGIDCDFPLTIGESAFQDCFFLRHLSLPIRLESLGDNAFKNTKNLENLEMREKSNAHYVPSTGHHLLETIPNGAFSGSHVKEVTIPSTVTLIEDNAFGETNYLEKVVFQTQKDQNGIQLAEQKPLVIKSGAFAYGNEQIIPNLDVYVNIDPNVRKVVCEYNAFNFTQMEGQTDENNEHRGTLHFDEAYWDYYQGDWKRGLTFSQSNLNAFKDGYNGTYTKNGQEITLIGLADETVRATDANFADNSTLGKYTMNVGSNQEYAPANGWQMFVATSTNVDITIKSGDFLRTYSTTKDYDIPQAVIGFSTEPSNIVDVYRVTAFDDGWRDSDEDKANINNREYANSKDRIATAVKLDYIPRNTGLIMKGNVPAGSGYVTYLSEHDFGDNPEWDTYPWNSSGDNVNFLMPTCVDEGNITVEENGESLVVLNPTPPYPSIPGVKMARDRAYLKLPTNVFHWSNEEYVDEGHGQTVSGLDDSAVPSRITLKFDVTDDGELTIIEQPMMPKAIDDDDSFYTLQGVKLSRPQGKGLYIYKGKKIFVK